MKQSLNEMIGNFDLISFEDGFFSSGCHKRHNTLDTIQRRIKELRKQMGEKESQPHCFFLMELALILKNEQKESSKITMLYKAQAMGMQE